jgi:hypothetical protein
MEMKKIILNLSNFFSDLKKVNNMSCNERNWIEFDL